MGWGKWIGGIFGFMNSGPLGALVGYALGAMFDKVVNVSPSDEQQRDSWGENEYTSESESDSSYGQRNSFLFSMLVMASYIIKADGKVMHSEMEYVRNFLRENFGPDAVSQGEQILLNLFEQRKQMDAERSGAYRETIRQCGRQIAENLTYEQRLQLLSFLVQIAKSDGKVCASEIDALMDVAIAMRLSEAEVDSLLNLGGNSLEQAYRVLEVDPSATNDEIRASYRRLALLHHPDKVATLGEDVRKAAEKKFQDINAARDMIYKARGIR